MALHETQGAGYINPRALVRAQISLARKAGARFLPDTVLGLDETADGVSIRTDQGTVLVNQVLVAAGGFANSVLATPLPLTVFARTVVLMEIDTAEAARLSAMPSLIWLEPDGNDPYLLPPIRYPDGRTYLKMGGDVVDVACRILRQPRTGSGPAEIPPWGRCWRHRCAPVCPICGLSRVMCNPA